MWGANFYYTGSKYIRFTEEEKRKAKELSEKRKKIGVEITKLVNELKEVNGNIMALGLALFGSKAKEKRELLSKRDTQEAEINNKRKELNG